MTAHAPERVPGHPHPALPEVKASSRAEVLRFIAKILGLQFGFLFLHYAYDFFPTPLVSIFSGVNESTFQHLKIAFFAYIVVNAVEALARRRQIRDWGRFVFARVFSTTFLPWVIFILFYTCPAYIGRLDSIAADVVYANVMMLLITYSTLVLERTVETAEHGRDFQIVVMALFLISVSLYVIFTYRMPWLDMFVPAE